MNTMTDLQRAGLNPAQREDDGVEELVALGLFFHSACPTVENDAVFFGPDIYRFAAAIEQLIASNRPPVQRAIDIGCGAGPGAILVAKRFPQAEVLAADINPFALKLCAANVALAGTANVLPCMSDLLKDVEGKFDLIVSNPPYLVDPSQRAYRHGGGHWEQAFHWTSSQRPSIA